MRQEKKKETSVRRRPANAIVTATTIGDAV
jgi:hypothetical protein